MHQVTIYELSAPAQCSLAKHNVSHSQTLKSMSDGVHDMCAAAFWNWAMVATARFLPVKIITDRAKIRAFAKATSPVIKLVDPLIGEKVNCLPLLYMCVCCMPHVAYMSFSCMSVTCLLRFNYMSAWTDGASAAYGSTLLCLAL